MRLAIAILGALIAGAAAHAQSRDGFTGPLTGYEAQLLSDVWYEVREVENFEDINWREHGLKIDWDEYRDKRSRRAERHGRLEPGSPENERNYNDSPFSAEEAATMSLAWGRMRAAVRFEDIDWQATTGYRAR